MYLVCREIPCLFTILADELMRLLHAMAPLTDTGNTSGNAEMSILIYKTNKMNSDKEYHQGLLVRQQVYLAVYLSVSMTTLITFSLPLTSLHENKVKHNKYRWYRSVYSSIRHDRLGGGGGGWQWVNFQSGRPVYGTSVKGCVCVRGEVHFCPGHTERPISTRASETWRLRMTIGGSIILTTCFHFIWVQC